MSANEVGQIITNKNNSLNEEPLEQSAV